MTLELKVVVCCNCKCTYILKKSLQFIQIINVNLRSKKSFEISQAATYKRIMSSLFPKVKLQYSFSLVNKALWGFLHLKSALIRNGQTQKQRKSMEKESNLTLFLRGKSLKN